MVVQGQNDSPDGGRRSQDPSAAPVKAPDRHLVAVLAADAVDYSRRMDLNQERAYQDLVECRKIMSENVRRHGGATVSTPGDFLLAAFDSS